MSGCLGVFGGQGIEGEKHCFKHQKCTHLCGPGVHSSKEAHQVGKDIHQQSQSSFKWDWGQDENAGILIIPFYMFKSM